MLGIRKPPTRACQVGAVGMVGRERCVTEGGLAASRRVCSGKPHAKAAR